jgi:NAD(P)-dependent dehydrogenase (short-subunit alcohol dehydrogenase family)
MIKTIFITGASAGIGKATAKFFAAKGWHVIATMRTPENETELNLLNNVTLLPLDVTNVEQIKHTTQKALALGNVDVVFNNAGYAHYRRAIGTPDGNKFLWHGTGYPGFYPSFQSQKIGAFYYDDFIRRDHGFSV